VEENNLLLTEMAVVEAAHEDKFLSRYDLGYCLVAIDRYKRVVSTPKASLGGYKIDWSTFKVLEYVPGHSVTVSAPDITYNDNNENYRMSGTVIQIMKKQKKPLGIGVGNFKAVGEIVSETAEGMIVLFGIFSRP